MSNQFMSDDDPMLGMLQVPIGMDSLSIFGLRNNPVVLVASRFVEYSPQRDAALVERFLTCTLDTKTLHLITQLLWNSHGPAIMRIAAEQAEMTKRDYARLQEMVQQAQADAEDGEDEAPMTEEEASNPLPQPKKMGRRARRDELPPKDDNIHRDVDDEEPPPPPDEE